MNVLVVDPRFHNKRGGANYVGLKILEVVEQRFGSATYLSGKGKNLEELNEFFDLEINTENIDYVEKEKSTVFTRLEESGTATVLRRALEDYSFARAAKKREDKYDLIIFTRHIFDNSIRFKPYSVQYVHDYLEGVEDKNKAYKSVYRFFGTPVNNDNFDLNLFNSNYVKSRSTIDGKTIYPPVDDSLNFKEGDKDQAAFVGRIEQDKELEKLVDICEKVDLDLKIIGSMENEKYFEEISEYCEGKKVELVPDASREKLKEILENSSYGFSVKEEENFGINVVEYIKSGCIPIVYDSAGPQEIVELDELRFSDLDSAVESIKYAKNNFEKCIDYIKDRSEDFGESVFASKFEDNVFTSKIRYKNPFNRPADSPVYEDSSWEVSKFE